MPTVFSTVYKWCTVDVHENVNQNDGFCDTHNQERLSTNQSLQQTTDSSRQKHLRATK